MNFIIKHESKGRMRFHVKQYRMSIRQADILAYYLNTNKYVDEAKVYEATGDAVIRYVCSRSEIIEILKKFNYTTAEVPESYLQNSGRALNAEYKEKLISKVVMRFGRRLFLPVSVREVFTVCRSAKYICQGLKTLASGKIEVPVLDATSISVSILRNDMKTASSIMFMLSIGELLEEWTHKKSVDDLARSMSLHVEKVWLKTEDSEVLISSENIKEGDEVVVRMGNVIPFDGTVVAGEAMINQASLTGESEPMFKTLDATVYAGTVVEEGEITFKVTKVSGSSKFEQIVSMIEKTEKLKSKAEGKASHLADRLVPYSLGATALTYAITRNTTKALSILMVDFSCALKLAMPISVLSAIREASFHNVTVKGGKFLEAIADADTIVFDKTGTLTKATPTVAEVISFDDTMESDELLRVAACLEEHFAHSMAKAVVDAAKEKGLEHEEMHTKVEYIVAHGIATTISGKRAVIGSYHFVLEDEQCEIPSGKINLFANLPQQYSHLYLAIEGKLCGVICIEDPLRPEAAAVISSLKKAGIKNTVMMTGDSERTAKVVAEKVGIDKYFSEVLPEDKAKFVEEERNAGRSVIMIGDGINDSPALSAANVGIAISDGAEIAREIADITVGSDDLFELVALKAISNGLMKRIDTNYKRIVGFNLSLILLGIAGTIQPTTSALLHNASTLAFSIKSMEDYIK